MSDVWHLCCEHFFGRLRVTTLYNIYSDVGKENVWRVACVKPASESAHVIFHRILFSKNIQISVVTLVMENYKKLSTEVIWHGTKGPSIYDVRKILGFFEHLPPLVSNWDWSTVLNSRNLPYYIFFWANPPPPLSADVIYGCPLRP